MMTQTIDTHREQMIRWLEQGRGYEFLTMASHYIPVCPKDHYVRLMAIREYVKLNLITPAKDLLVTDMANNLLPQEFNTINDTLHSIQDTQTPWSNYSQQFEANLDALKTRGYDTILIRDLWRKREKRFQLYLDNNSLIQLRRRDDRGLWFWIPALRNHTKADDNQPLPDDVKAMMPGPYVFEGLGLGGYFKRVYQATIDTFIGFGCALLIVERDASALAALLHLHDWTEILSDPRVMLFTGNDWADQLQNALQDHPDIPIAKQVFTTGPRVPDTQPYAADIVHQAQAARETKTLQSVESVEQQYAGRDIVYWANRFEQALSGHGDPLRILGMVSIHTTFLQHSMRDARRAFEKLGHSCEIITEKTSYEVVSAITYQNAIRKMKPDLIFVLDHIRPEFGHIIPKNLPILSWDQDQLPHVFVPEKVTGIAPIDFIVGYSKLRCIQLGCNADQFLQTQMPTCPEQFGGDPLTDQEIEKYTCDVSFVSHASQTPQAFHQEERSQYQDQTVIRLLNTLYEMLLPALKENNGPHGMLYYTILEKAKQRCGITSINPELNQRLLTWYLWRLGDRIFRHEALQWAADWAQSHGRSLRIYGNGWENHPTLSPFAAGPADNGRELVCIYRASKINLQIMPSGFIHQRALDGLSAGGFFLSRITTNDMRGHLLHRLVQRIDELGISDSHTLLNHNDIELNSLLQEFFGKWFSYVDPNVHDTINGFKIAADMNFPDEVFSQFDQIAFDSAHSFAALADRFINNDSLRSQITDDMRKTVIERFSYPSTMNHFLRSMAGYLRKACV